MLRSRPAFTLIEVLVVVAVIAVLAGMLFPAIGAVRGAARTAACMGNLRQIGMGATTWSNEHHGLIIPSIMTGPASTHPVVDDAHDTTNDITRYWQGQLALSMGGSADPATAARIDGLFRCPCSDTATWVQYSPGTYGKNMQTGKESNPAWNTYGTYHCGYRYLAEVRHQDAVFIADSLDMAQFGSPGNARELHPLLSGGTWGLDYRHRGRAALLLLDMTVISRTRAELNTYPDTADDWMQKPLWNPWL